MSRPCRPWSPRGMGPALALAVALAAPGAQARSGVTITAFAGAGYLLDTTERPGAWSARSLFDFSAGLAVNGGFLRPQLLQWSAHIAYMGNRQVAQQGAAFSVDGLIFGANVALLAGTPTSLTLFANRGNTWVSEITPRRATGMSITTGFGATATVNFLNLPQLTASLSRSIVETIRADGERTSSGLTMLRVGANQQLKVLEYSAAYATNWSNGSFADLQYGSHDLSARAVTPLDARTQFSVSEQYYVRLPTVEAPTNPRYESNAVTSLLTWRRSDQLTASLGYGNLQSSVFAPSTLDATTSSHSLAQGLQWRLRDDLILGQRLGAQTLASRTGAYRHQGARGDLGLSATWLRPTSWGGASLGGGGTFGVAGEDGAPVQPAWGANLDAQLSVLWGRLSGSASYSLVYADTGTLLFGRSYRQNLRLEAIYVPAPRWRLRAFFAGSGARRDDATVGTSLQRSLQAVLEARFRQHQLLIFAGYGDGLPESLGNPVFADGLFLPAPFNSQYKNLGATVSTSVFNGGLSLRATVRFTEVSGLGRPTEDELGVTASVGWRLGKFVLSAEDRLLLGGAGPGWYRQNTVMVRLTRDFDWSF